MYPEAVLPVWVQIPIAVWLGRLNRADKLLAASLSLILGGAIGNLWDRVFFNGVRDFIDFKTSLLEPFFPVDTFEAALAR